MTKYNEYMSCTWVSIWFISVYIEYFNQYSPHCRWTPMMNWSCSLPILVYRGSNECEQQKQRSVNTRFLALLNTFSHAGAFSFVVLLCIWSRKKKFKQWNKWRRHVSYYCLSTCIADNSIFWTMNWLPSFCRIAHFPSASVSASKVCLKSSVIDIYSPEPLYCTVPLHLQPMNRKFYSFVELQIIIIFISSTMRKEPNGFVKKSAFMDAAGTFRHNIFWFHLVHHIVLLDV